jgi:hypothetical protein
LEFLENPEQFYFYLFIYFLSIGVLALLTNIIIYNNIFRNSFLKKFKNLKPFSSYFVLNQIRLRAGLFETYVSMLKNGLLCSAGEHEDIVCYCHKFPVSKSIQNARTGNGDLCLKNLPAKNF